ncbi:MAG: ADP-ribosylation factor-like protein [Candidatus Thorarchaeota archaeon]
MLHNIFLFKGKELQDLEDLNIYCYPKEIINIGNKILINKIIKGHDQGNSDEVPSSKVSIIYCKNSTHYTIDKPVAQYVNGLNIYTSCIDENNIIGLIFENEDNPYDYKEIFEELLTELLNKDSGYFFEDDTEIDNFLISMFIDIRRYGDEVVEKPSELEYYFQRESFFKVFLFGIDEVGKSSFVRRLKTGEFNDNYFTPTRKFDIQYIQAEEGGLLAFWDMPGQQLFRKKWLIGLQDSNIIVYMIDIANQRRFEESKKELWKILRNNELIGIPLLVLSNKVDLIVQRESNNTSQLESLRKEVITYFDLDRIRDRDWKFIFTSVKTNFNIKTTIRMIFDLLMS